MHRDCCRNHLGLTLLAALACACLLGDGAGFAADPEAGGQAAAPATGSADHTFTAIERKKLMDFLLQYDMGKSVHPGVEALLRRHDDACAVTLVMDTYGVPPETAMLFVRLVGRAASEAPTPAKP